MIKETTIITEKFLNAKSSMHDHINSLRLTNDERGRMFDLLWDMENAFGELKTIIPKK